MEGFEYQKTGQPLIDPQTGKAIESYWYTPYEHEFYARNKLAPLLESKTIWDIMELDFEHEWLPKKMEKIDDTQQ